MSAPGRERDAAPPGVARWLLVNALIRVAASASGQLVEGGFTPAALGHLAARTARHDQHRGAALGAVARMPPRRRG